MKIKTIVAIAIIGLAAIGTRSYASSEEAENKQKVAMSELPAAVQKTIQDNLGGGTIVETAKETKEGQIYYEAEIQKSGGEKIEVKVAEDGKLIRVGKEEEEDEDND
jgi:hypothetical protein